ncbi:hypothetical protein AM1_2092 [Acaryochloris marina MBIC11017]|uniref:Uncharacterized protein n=1 Tax=Acaryochloris marina (strain MBIC 11017) TaxID=329726 RepID=B0BYU1_ACAM1|nr:hypothetical protein AM1_2092 [Acaryochloris marina MBIC11017]
MGQALPKSMALGPTQTLKWHNRIARLGVGHLQKVRGVMG